MHTRPKAHRHRANYLLRESFDLELLEELKRKELVIVPELNYQGQFASILRSHGVKAEAITQYTGLPFKVRDLVERISEMTKSHQKEMVRA